MGRTALVQILCFEKIKKNDNPQTRIGAVIPEVWIQNLKHGTKISLAAHNTPCRLSVCIVSGSDTVRGQPLFFSEMSLILRRIF